MVGLGTGQRPDDQLVSKLHAATAGNPLFVDGLLRVLIVDRNAESDGQFKTPDTLREAIRHRRARRGSRVA